MLTEPITSDTDLNHVIKVVSPSFFHCLSFQLVSFEELHRAVIKYVSFYLPHFCPLPQVFIDDFRPNLIL